MKSSPGIQQLGAEVGVARNNFLPRYFYCGCWIQGGKSGADPEAGSHRSLEIYNLAIRNIRVRDRSLSLELSRGMIH